MNSTFDPMQFVDSNPLLQGLLGLMGPIEWGKALFNDPSSNWYEVIAPRRRLVALDQIANVYVPSFEDTEAAVRLHLMIVNSLIQRDPRLESNREWTYHAFGALHKTIDDIPPPPFQQMRAQGAILEGPSGSGKTAFRQRFCSQIVQTIFRPENIAMGWKELKQLIWLVAEMPADGSRQSLCISIAQGMDRALGTTYSQQLARVKGVDSKLVHIVHWLNLHRCSMLFIEESQDGDLSAKIIGTIFKKFFLRLLNSGTPVVLMGIPLAFEDLMLSSQDLNRFTEGGDWKFYPEMTWTTSRWVKDLMPTLWGYTIFGRSSDAEIKDLPQLIWYLTGGLPSYVRRLRRETLLFAINTGRNAVDHACLVAGVQSAAMQGVRPVISAYIMRDHLALAAFNDQPVSEFRKRWSPFVSGKTAETIPSTLSGISLSELYPKNPQ